MHELISALAGQENALFFEEAHKKLPSKPGFYALHLKELNRLPSDYVEEFKHNRCGLIYVGKSQRSLLQRVAEEHRTNSSPSTFFRSVGALLGYLPMKGSISVEAANNNYHFSATDTQTITEWLDQNVKITFVEMPIDKLRQYEEALIKHFRPLLNQTYNPACSQLLKHARKACIAHAKLQT